MRSVRSVVTRLIATMLLLASGQAAADCNVLITQARLGYEGEVAGLKAQDCVLAWRKGARGEPAAMADPLEFFRVEFEEAPYGDVELQVRSGTTVRWITMASGSWNVDALPSLSSVEREVLAQWQSAIESENLTEWPTSLASRSPRQAAALAIWRARVSSQINAATADPVLSAAEDSVRAVGEPVALALVSLVRCMQSQADLRLSDAVSQCRAASASAQAADLPLVQLLADLMAVATARQQGRFDAVERLLDPLETQVGARIPHSLMYASLIYERAWFLRSGNRLDAALIEVERGMRLLDELHGADRLRQSFATVAGLVLRARGDPEKAQARLEQAVAISERIEPDSLSLSRALNNLALVQWDRADMISALKTLERSLEIKRRRNAMPMDLVASYANLALVAMPLGRLDAAYEYSKKEVAILRTLGNGALLANALVTAARIAGDRGNPDLAHRYFDEALMLFRSHAPDSIFESWGRIFHSKQLAKDERLLEALAEAKQAVVIQRQVNPGARELSYGLQQLGEVARDLGQTQEALRAFEEAFSLRRKHSPDSHLLARSLHDAGAIESALGRSEPARALFCEAVEVLERQRWRWSRSRDDLLKLSNSNTDIYRDCAVALLKSGRSAEAFDALEQSRGRVLLESLGYDRAVISDSLPESLKAMWRDLQNPVQEKTSLANRTRQAALLTALQAQAPAQV